MIYVRLILIGALIMCIPINIVQIYKGSYIGIVCIIGVIISLALNILGLITIDIKNRNKKLQEK